MIMILIFFFLRRKPRKQQHHHHQQHQLEDFEEVNVSKLSEEAFRLLRTVKSLLSTREPDLTSRLNNGGGASMTTATGGGGGGGTTTTTCSPSPSNIADVSSASSTISATLESDTSENYRMRDANNPMLEISSSSSSTPPPPPLPPPQQQQQSSTRCNGRRRRSSRDDITKGSSPPQMSIISSSADDESGFSSLNSFQEIGIPIANSTYYNTNQNVKNKMDDSSSNNNNNKYNREMIGLPQIDNYGCKVHRRWSSTPVDNHNLSKLRPASFCTTNGESIGVLWV